MHIPSHDQDLLILDDFLPPAVVEALKKEHRISGSILNQDQANLSPPQELLLNLTQAALYEYCLKVGYKPEQYRLCNFQLGSTRRYNEQSVTEHLYEPHHDIAEVSRLSAVYFLDSSYDGVNWCGGELAIYRSLSFTDYPENTVNIRPVNNRLVFFNGFMIHRVKPYFGDRPRRTYVLGFERVERNRGAEHAVIL